MKKTKMTRPIWRGIDTTFLPRYYFKDGKKYETRTNKEVKNEK